MNQYSRTARGAGLLAAGLFALASASPALADGAGAAKPAEPQKHYRWGAGWDEGLALRARLANGWGLGLRVNPDLIDPESSGTSTSTNSSDWLCDSYRECPGGSQNQSSQSASGDVRLFAASLMGYHEKKLGKHLAVGPYLALNFERRREARTETYESQALPTASLPVPIRPSSSWSTRTTTKRWERTFGIELGVRPTFRFHDRFVLESRFGLEWAHTKWNDATETHSESTDGGIVCPACLTETASSSVAPPPNGKTTSDTTSEDKGTQRRLHAVGERLGPGASLRFIVLF